MFIVYVLIVVLWNIRQIFKTQIEDCFYPISNTVWTIENFLPRFSLTENVEKRLDQAILNSNHFFNPATFTHR